MQSALEESPKESAMPFVNSHHADIYYDVIGEGPAMVLAHGRGGNSASWFQQVPVFAQNHKVVVFDHRCFGRSVCDPAHFDRKFFADDLAAVMDAAGVEKAAVVCQSMGGWSGLRLAVEQPVRVAALVLSNTTGGASTAAAEAAMVASRQAFATHGISASALAPGFPTREPGLAYLYGQLSGLNLQVNDSLHSISPAATSADELAALKPSVMMITSENDTIFPSAAIREIAGMIPGCELAELPDAGHSPYFETAAAFNDAVLGFLAKHLS
jgi:pimeloyl-ACP methyl ester carboxylesterase